MLKWLAILSVFLAIAEAPIPVPRQTAEPAAQGSDKANNQSQGNQNPSAPASTLVKKPEQAVPPDASQEKPRADDKEHSIKLTSLPPVTIADKHKTFWNHVLDWGPWAFGLITAIAAGFQVWLLFRTWRTIGRQADIMERQASEAKESGAQTFAVLKEQSDNALISAESATVIAMAADKSAKAALDQIQMVKDKERARISVSVPDDKFEISPAYSFDAITIKIANDGTTSAFNVIAKAEIFGHPSEDLPPMRPFIPLTIPSVIRANSPPTHAQVILVQDFDMKSLEESPIPYFFHIGGIVEYDDVFGQSHETTFRYRLKVNGVLQIPDSENVKIRSWGGWKRTPEENRAT
jgi:hypothetical protein